MSLIQAIGSDVIAIQEHSIQKGGVSGAKASLASIGYGAVLTDSDPETQSPSGGVGILVKKPRAYHELHPKTEVFQQSRDLGRAVLAMIGVGTHVPVMVASLYGWSTQEAGEDRFERTSALLDSLIAELREWPVCPTLIMGDFNGLPSKFMSLVGALREGTLHDMGANAEAWGAALMPPPPSHTMLRSPRGSTWSCATPLSSPWPEPGAWAILAPLMYTDPSQ